MRLIYSKYINGLLTIYESHSLIPSSSSFFLPFVAISTKRPHFLACKTRDQIFKKSKQTASFDVTRNPSILFL